jgi:hypothetical protein
MLSGVAVVIYYVLWLKPELHKLHVPMTMPSFSIPTIIMTLIDAAISGAQLPFGIRLLRRRQSARRWAIGFVAAAILYQYVRLIIENYAHLATIVARANAFGAWVLLATLYNALIIYALCRPEVIAWLERRDRE